MASVIREIETSTAEPQKRLFTRDEFYQLDEHGFFAGQRVELIEGEILLMSPVGPDHDSAVGLVIEALQSAFGKGYWIRPQMSLALGKRSEPQPDLAVIEGSPKSVKKTPRTALLVVEISYSTRLLDRGQKAKLYAKAGIQDYWVVDLVTKEIVVHRHPTKIGYTQVTEHKAGEKVSPLVLPKRKINVEDLLP